MGAVALIMRYRLDSKRNESQQTGTLKYTIICDETGNYRLYAHDGADKLDDALSKPTISSAIYFVKASTGNTCLLNPKELRP